MDFSEQLAFYARIAEQKGLVNSLEGNLSVIDRETGNIYITPSHKMKLTLQSEQVCIIDQEGNQIGGTGKRSSEFFLHQAAYAARPDIGAVIHCHCPYLTAHAMKLQDLCIPEDAFLHMVYGTIRCLPYGEHGTHAIHQGIEEALDGRPVALLGGHGVVCVGADLEDALGLLEGAENFAKIMYINR